MSALLALALLAAAPPAVDPGVPPSKPLGALLGQATLAFTGWPTPRGDDGPCGKAVAHWLVQDVFKGDKSLKGKIVPVYGKAPLNLEPRTTSLFLQGPADCPEVFWQQEVVGEMLSHSIQKPADCEVQLQVVGRVLRGLATDCDADRDCEAFSLHPNSCERPHPYAIRAKTALPAWWPALATRARTSCSAQWSRQPACAPVVMPVHCHEHACVEGPALGATPFARATLGESCAPTDAAATSVILQPQGAEYPQLSVNWWNEDRPQRGKAGTYDAGGLFSKSGYGATYCPVANGCQALRSVKVHLRLGEDGKGELELQGETQSGESIKANVPAEYGPMRKVFCG